MSIRPTEGVPGAGPAEVHGLIGQGAIVVDVREQFEWDAGHAPMARHIPLGSLADAVDGLPKDKHLVLVCRSGGRSARATAFLVESGFQATNLDGGMKAWAEAGLPVESDDGTPGVIA
ncbi:MAG TPA: rhodanese-like domain-containing protein [Acidimicrobiales bacterium]|nr:rhodanese-like domain-containing protein [Acidimicrobiales bacterium]